MTKQKKEETGELMVSLDQFTRTRDSVCTAVVDFSRDAIAQSFAMRSITAVAITLHISSTIASHRISMLSS